MLQCILKSKIVFLDKTNYLYTLIEIKEKGFSITDIDRQTFKSYNLPKVFSDSTGTIYADNDFKEVINNDPTKKEKILKILKSLDE